MRSATRVAIAPAVAAPILVAYRQEPQALFSALALCLPGLALAIRFWGSAALVAPLLACGLLVDQARHAIPLIHTMPIGAPGPATSRRLTGWRRYVTITPRAGSLPPPPGRYYLGARVQCD